MHATEHLRSANRAALAFGVLLGIAVMSLGVHVATRAAHVATVVPACAATPSQTTATADGASDALRAAMTCRPARDLG